MYMDWNNMYMYDGTLVVPYLCPVSAAPIHMHNTLTEYLSIPV